MSFQRPWHCNRSHDLHVARSPRLQSKGIEHVNPFPALCGVPLPGPKLAHHRTHRLRALTRSSVPSTSVQTGVSHVSHRRKTRKKRRRQECTLRGRIPGRPQCTAATKVKNTVQLKRSLLVPIVKPGNRCQAKDGNTQRVRNTQLFSNPNFRVPVLCARAFVSVEEGCVHQHLRRAEC